MKKIILYQILIGFLCGAGGFFSGNFVQPECSLQSERETAFTKLTEVYPNIFIMTDIQYTEFNEKGTSFNGEVSFSDGGYKVYSGAAGKLVYPKDNIVIYYYNVTDFARLETIKKPENYAEGLSLHFEVSKKGIVFK